MHGIVTGWRLPAAFCCAAGLFAVTGSLWAADAGKENCVVTGRVCVEAGGTRLVDGVPVTRDCWSYRDTYACMVPDTESVNGCSTLQADADDRGPGKCVMKDRTCSEEIKDVEGQFVCLSYKETWVCDKKIKLPPVNAEWTRSTVETEDEVDESACGELLDRQDCTKGEVKCTESGCERVFYCNAKTATGCSDLAAGGCTITKAPTCDTDIDPACLIKVGEAVCKGKLPEGVVEDGNASIEDEETVNVGQPTQDVESCTQMANDLENSGMHCTQISQVCVDKDPPVRVINGIPYRASCWGYERVYRCERTEPASTCKGLEASEGCTEVERTCVKNGPDGCEAERVVYNCGKVESVDPGDAELIESGDEISGIVEVDTCSALETNDICRKTAEVCTEPGGTKIVNGVPVTKDCWATEITYTCGSGAGDPVTDDGCESLEKRKDCKLTESKCLGRDEDGNCTMLTKTFVCGGGTEEIVTGKDCDGELCIAGICEPTKPETSDDFLEGVAIWEILRQAGIYGEVEGDMLFKGTASGCSVKMMGFSCCRNDVEGTAGTMSNSALSIGLTIGVDAGTEFIKWLGSPYVYDILNSFESTQGVLQALYGSAGSGVYSPSLSYYGVSVGISSTGSLTLEFSPASFLASIALEMAAEYFSCTNEDRMHALRKSRGLCHYVGSFCDKKSGAGCLEKKETWVCFNSKLARTVQEEGRKQLGISWGTPERPVTRGFTLEEFQRLDFTKMDLTPVVAEIAEKAAKDGTLAGKKVRTQAVTERARVRVKEAVESSDHYTEVKTVTGKCFMGESDVGVDCTAVYSLLAGYEAPAREKTRSLRTNRATLLLPPDLR